MRCFPNGIIVGLSRVEFTGGACSSVTVMMMASLLRLRTKFHLLPHATNWVIIEGNERIRMQDEGIF